MSDQERKRGAGQHPPLVYLDHGATSWPKPPGVAEAVARGVTELGGNPGRGAYRLAVDTARAIHAARHAAARFLGVPDATDLSFQPGCTHALNLVLFGLLQPGDRVVAGPTEHNAVARPLNLLASRGVDVVMIETDESGVVDVDMAEEVIAAAPTRAVVCQHAGNVSGAIQPVADLVDVAHAYGATMIVDGAQAGGHLPVDIAALGVDAWVCSGHKGLLGPQGVGLMYLDPACQPAELVAGGTGAGESELPLQPTIRPDRYEAGTPPTPAILGLGAAIEWLAQHCEESRAEESRLTRRLHEGLLELDGFHVIGPEAGEARIPIVSVVHDRIPADRLAFSLDRRFGVAARAGLHCAPWAHRAFGTLDTGALRFGVGFGNTDADIDHCLASLATLIEEHS